MLKLESDPTKTRVVTRDGRPAEIYAVYPHGMHRHEVMLRAIDCAKTDSCVPVQITYTPRSEQ